MKIAAIQFQALENKISNISRALKLIAHAAGQRARLIALPEIFVFRGRILNQKHLSEISEPIPGPATAQLQSLARKHKVFILAGSLYEKIFGGKRVYNTSVLINPQGSIIAKYRKINLFDAKFGRRKIKESKIFLAGECVKAAAINNFKAGLSICYDLRFPGLYQNIHPGPDILFVPSAFTQKTGQAHWEVLLRARAIENLCYCVAPNQIGTDSRGITCYGHSMVIGPWGEILAEASENKEEIIYASLNLSAIRSARKILPSLKK